MVLNNESAGLALDAYREAEAHLDGPRPPSCWLFPSTSASSHLTRQSLGLDLKQLAIVAGLDPERVSPHMPRHAFSSHLVDRREALRAVPQRLGNGDITAIEIYIHVLEKPLIRLVNDHHPLATPR